MSQKKDMNRKDFIIKGSRMAATICLGGVCGHVLANRSVSREMVWQIDPEKCVYCGNCATHCIHTQSAVRAVHAFDVCGYCNLCVGYFPPSVTDLSTAAENHLCPTSAIKRTYVEEPFFEYSIDKDLCVGCSKCVKGCAAFGNSSLYLQIQHDICTNCNECAISRSCPSDAISRVPADEAYNLKGNLNKI